MSDVFLSYSRRDTKFVREIFELLSAHKREAWIDLHDIDYSAKWWEEICSGIDGADNFVLFVSPNSLESLFCHREIHYALEHNKRIIPFLIEPIDQQNLFQSWRNNPDLSNYEQLAHENWESIQAIQWIDFTQINDVNMAVDALLATVDVDPERVKLHTRLLLRVRDWESSGRNPSGLLRGDELTQYEQWFDESLQKGTPPHPTGEQEVYIHESRRVQDESEAKRIQRERLIHRFRTASIVLGGFFALAIIATIATVVVTNRTVNVANTQVAVAGSTLQAGTTLIASGHTQVAVIGQTLTPIPPQLTSVARTIVAGSYMIESLNLSADSNSILRTEGGNAETAALLGIRVLRKIYLASADSALVEAISRIKAVPLVMSSIGNVKSVAFSPDGKTFLVSSSDFSDKGAIELRDTASGSVIWSKSEKIPLINSVAFSPDGKLVVAAGGDQTAIVLDAASGKQIRTLSGHTDAVQRAVFSPDGKTILTLGGGNDMTVRLWETETGRQIYSVPSVAGNLSLFFLPDGQTFYAVGGVYSAADGHSVQGIGIGGGALAISPDGKTYVTGINPVAEIHETNSGSLVRKLIGHTDSVISAAFSNDGKWLVTGSKDNTTRVWDTASGKQLMLLSGNSSMVWSVAISPDKTNILIGSKDAQLFRISPDNQQLTFSVPAGVTSSALAPDGKTILVGDVDGNSGLWDINSGLLLRNFPAKNAGINSVAFSPDGKFAALPESGSVNIYDPSTGELVKTFTGNSRQPWIEVLTFSADSKMLFVEYKDDTARLWDVENGTVLRQFSGNDPLNMQGAASFSPDAKLAVFDSGKVWWDVSSGEKVKYPEEMSRGISIKFSGDGSLLAVNLGRMVSVWKVSTKQLVNSFQGHTDQITSIAFSPDDRLLLTGSADKTIRMWDISTGQNLRVFSGHTAAVTSITFTPDGKRIVSGSLDKTIRTWITDYNDLLAYACSRVGVDFTPDERAAYGISDEEPTCPQFGVQSQPLLPTTTPMPTPTQLPLWTPIATPTP